MNEKFTPATGTSTKPNEFPDGDAYGRFVVLHDGSWAFELQRVVDRAGREVAKWPRSRIDRGFVETEYRLLDCGVRAPKLPTEALARAVTEAVAGARRGRTFRRVVVKKGFR